MSRAPRLLSRQAFSEQVFARDGGRCVFCNEAAVDAHHILERRLWPDGGYYLDNGASVCEKHHLLCEQTVISTEDVREKCGIQLGLLPPHLEDGRYDKWGNPVVAGGMRLKGELFFEEPVQKVLRQSGVLDLFLDRTRFPRTLHLPISPGVQKDDKILHDLSSFEGEEVVITSKKDGENTTMARDYLHARSVDSRHHESRDWVKAFHGKFAHDIPEGWRICGENVYALHSIAYDNLPTYFFGFHLWNEVNVRFSWDEMLEYFAVLGVTPVPTIGEIRVFDPDYLMWLASKLDTEKEEGFVVTKRRSFKLAEFRTSVVKWVRPDHVQTDEHWRTQAVIPNRLASGAV